MNAASLPKKVLITGAHGLIGNLLYAHLASQPERYDPYGMVRSAAPRRRRTGEKFFDIPPEKMRLADLHDAEAVQRAAEGMDVVVHLAADPTGMQGWDSVLENNIRGTYHMLEASRLAGVQRFVFGSTNQTVFGYRTQEPYQALFEGRFEDVPPDYHRIDHSMPPRTLNYYASSKVFGEMLTHMYAYTHNVPGIALRIGWVTDEDRPPLLPKSRLNGRILWCSHRDITQIHRLCIDAPASLRFDTFFGQSDNRYNLVDIQHAKDVLGYRPQDDAEDYVD